MRNALVLIITTIGLQFGSMMGQAVVVEVILVAGPWLLADR